MLGRIRWRRGLGPAFAFLAGGWRGNSPTASARRELARRRATLTELTELAWPITAAMLGDVAMGLVDTRLVAGLGAHALGGVGMASTLLYLNYAVVFGLMRGVKVRASHAIGEGHPERGTRYAQAGLLLGVTIGVAVWALGRDATWAFTGLGADASTVAPGREFLAARTWGAPFLCALSALVQHRQGVGDTRTPMVVGLVANVVNAWLAYGLIYGRSGLPALGVAGAGYATASVEALECVALLAVLMVERRREKRTRVGDPLAFRVALREVCSLGVPTGLQFGMETLAFTTFTAVLSGLGAEQIAAHQIAMSTIRVSFLPGIAVGEAASVLIGRALGRRRLDEADRINRAAILLGASFMTACGLGFALFGGAIARGFMDDPAVTDVARRLLLVAALFQTLDAITISLRGALRAAQDVRVVAVIGIAAAWCCTPTAAYLLGRLAGLGALGGWCGFVAETAVASALLWRRWTRGAWRARYAATRPDAPPPRIALATAA